MNLLITGAWKQAKKYMKVLEERGHCIEFLQFEKDELPCKYEWVEGIIGNGIFLTHPIEKFQNLKYIQLTSAGFDRVPMDYVKEHGIMIDNARGVYSVPMAEFAIAGVLSLYKKLQFFRDKQNVCTWEKNRNLKELYGKNICIVGCGSIGTECAKRFNAFGCTVLGVDINAKVDENFSKIYGIEDIEEILSESDIVIITLPLTNTTYHIFDKKRLANIKNGAVIVNISRGGVIDTEALIEALHDNLGGAVLDVFEEEPLSCSSPLWQMKNVIVTPHNSFVGENNDWRLSKLILKNIENAVV